VVVGDFNSELGGFPLESAFAQLGWLDVGTGATSAAAALPRRIDWALANALARRGLLSVRLDWGLALPVHAAHWLQLRAGNAKRPEPVGPPDPGAAVGRCLEQLRGATAAAAAADVDGLWRLLQCAADADFGQALPSAAARVQPAAARRCRPDPAPLELYEARRRRGLLRAAHRALLAEPADRAAACRFWSIAAGLPGSAEWRPFLEEPPTVAVSMGLLAAAEAQCEQMGTRHREERSKRWHSWCSDQHAVGGGRLYGWLRSPAPVPPAAASEDLPAEGSEQDLRRLEAFWQGLWRAVGTGGQVGPLLAPLEELPPFPPLAPLTGAELRHVAERSSVRKATGWGGWGYGHLRQLPAEWYDALASLLRLVEAGGKWPAAFEVNVVALLPKKGTRAPDDRRPIVLLPVVYRVWAACRAQPLRAWLRGAGLLSSGPAAAADYQAGLRSLTAPRAHADGDELAGLAVDWS